MGMIEAGALDLTVPGLSLWRRGKVRDVYDLGENLLMVASDRISAFDHILPTPVAGKGRWLNEISAFWFRKTGFLAANHFLTDELKGIAKALPGGVRLPVEDYEGRVMLVKKARRIDVECVVRGYLAGSAWKEYQAGGSVAGEALPAGLIQAAKLPDPIFTPAAKADTGHDENITRGDLKRRAGAKLAARLEETSLRLYCFAAEFLARKGLLLADTKFEFGLLGEDLVVIDEMITPDSSRLWPAARYRAGQSPESLDKQYVRDYLESVHWDKAGPAPALPPETVRAVQQRYREFARIITS